MGKIPAKKHRGVKDVEKQHAKRLAELESRTNIAPKDADEQAIPRSLEHMIKLKEAAKTNDDLKRKRKKKNKLICVGQQHSKLSLHPKAKPEKIVPVLQQRPIESSEEFLQRVSEDTKAFLREIAVENKYGFRIDRNPETGRIQRITSTKPLPKDDVETSQVHKNIKRERKTTETPLTKSEKRKQKLRLKREKKVKNADEFEHLQDKIAFNEVAHEPPKLNIKPRKPINAEKMKNLLLNSLEERRKRMKRQNDTMAAVISHIHWRKSQGLTDENWLMSFLQTLKKQ